MSLVNDALQKVHAQTTQRQAAVPGGGAGAVPYRFNKPQRDSSLGWWVGGGSVVVLGIAVAVAIVFMHRTPQATVAPVAAAVQVVAAPVPNHVSTASAAPTTQPAAPVIVPTPAASGLANAPAAAPVAAAPTTQPVPTSVAASTESPPAVAAMAPPATAPATLSPLSVAAPVPTPAPAAAPVTAVIDLQSLSVPGLGKLKLTGIALSPFGTRAVINNTIISVGDTVGPATITDIQDKRVKLEIAGKTYTLSLP